MRPLQATYRVQFNPDFSFEDAENLVPYWARLGISHVYASPIFAARKGSTHGYDIIDHRAISPELGGEPALRRLADRLHEAGMGLILDIVPNHMGVGGDENDFWLDLLEFGSNGPAAAFFDVDWRDGSILLPILGETVAEALAAGSLVPEWEPRLGRIGLRYGGQFLPLSPKTLFRLLMEAAGPQPDQDVLSAGLDWLGHHEGKDMPRPLAELRRTLTDVVAKNGRAARILEVLEDELRVDDETMAAQKRLFDEQYWRLAHWRTARDELNYRRFFSIVDLAAVRAEEPEVFRTIHALPLRLLAEGVIDGLRVDHVDGLADPAAYCLQLRGAAGEDATIHVEKILGRGENLRRWPIDGTTGYETLNLINGLFVEPNGYLLLAERAATSGMVPGPDQLRERVSSAKRDILNESFVTELNQVTKAAKRLADRSLQTCDLTEETLKRSLSDLLVEFPVYRSYLTALPCDTEDRALIEACFAGIVLGADPWQQTAFDFLRTMLLETVDDAEAAVFKTRFQQLTAPLMAKGYEDTELYRYVVLVSANEVGSHVDAPVVETSLFHWSAKQQLRQWPKALIPLATHDTKRGADMRARLNVLSECAAPWIEACLEWTALNRRFRTEDAEQAIPGALDEMLIYQTLAGCWPIGVDRLLPYLQKVIREARLHGNWENPDTAYEEGVSAFVTHLLEAPAGAEFRQSFVAFLKPIIAAGRLNGLAQTIIQLMMPGVPDIYWGTEFWDLTLVDPDNRRPVDWQARMQGIDRFSSSVELPLDQITSDDEGVLKQAVIAKLLDLRRRCPVLFEAGEYHRLEIRQDEEASSSYLAFAREADHRCLIVVVPVRGLTVLTEQVSDRMTILLPEEWEGRKGSDLLSGRGHRLTTEMKLTQILPDYPFCVIEAMPGEG